MTDYPEPPDWRPLLERQQGVVTRDQLVARGLSRAEMTGHVAAGRWQRPIPGIYVTFKGPLPELTRLWVALLHAGPDAVLSHGTAATLWGLLRPRRAAPVHVTIPLSRGTRPRRGLVVHRSRIPPVAVGWPPRTGVAVTAVDLCAGMRRLSDVSSLVGRVAQRYPGEVAALRSLVAGRRNLRGRADVLALIDDVAGGVHSELERRYLVDVERAHGLPPGTRQRAVDGTRQDVHHREYRTTVELDGRAVHESVDAAWRDLNRDNAAAARGEVTLRYGWLDVRSRPCEVAAQVAAVLRERGWEGRPTPCGPGCCVADLAA